MMSKWHYRVSEAKFASMFLMFPHCYSVFTLSLIINLWWTLLTTIPILSPSSLIFSNKHPPFFLVQTKISKDLHFISQDFDSSIDISTPESVFSSRVPVLSSLLWVRWGLDTGSPEQLHGVDAAPAPRRGVPVPRVFYDLTSRPSPGEFWYRGIIPGVRRPKYSGWWISLIYPDLVSLYWFIHNLWLNSMVYGILFWFTLWLCPNSYWTWPSPNGEFSHE